jgi:AAA+ superfamily predicted ATPase
MKTSKEGAWMVRSNDEVIAALRAALDAAPENAALRKHLADLLLERGDLQAAEAEYRQVLTLDPEDSEAKLSLAETFYRRGKAMVALVILEELMGQGPATAAVYLLAARAYLMAGHETPAREAYTQAITTDPLAGDAKLAARLNVEGAPPREGQTLPPEDRVALPVEEVPEGLSVELERSPISFKDVGGMEALKEEIRYKIIHPLAHPELYRAYGKTVGGGILMYGPPGCGKTHLARATAGEVNAYFLPVGLHDVLDMYIGQSERNLHELFQLARRHAPCVLFIDEVDALGASRTDMRRSAGRQIINQFLAEMDGIHASNEGVLLLAATNAPWHMDAALRRPGRFDRVVFVPPPDLEARIAILQIMLQGKPSNEIDYARLARRTDGFSGADLKGMVDVAVESKLREALAKGIPEPLTSGDLLTATKSARPSTKDWFATARNYALYSNVSGLYDDVLNYLDKGNEGSDLFSRLPFRRNR